MCVVGIQNAVQLEFSRSGSQSTCVKSFIASWLYLQDNNSVVIDNPEKKPGCLTLKIQNMFLALGNVPEEV